LIASFSRVAAHGAERSLGIPAAEHRAHALLGGRDDGQPVTPFALAELGEDDLRGVVELEDV